MEDDRLVALRTKLKVEDELDCLLTLNEVRSLILSKLNSVNYALEQLEQGNVTKAYGDYWPVAALEDLLDTIENGHIEKQRKEWERKLEEQIEAEMN